MVERVNTSPNDACEVRTVQSAKIPPAPKTTNPERYLLRSDTPECDHCSDRQRDGHIHIRGKVPDRSWRRIAERL